MEKIHTLFDGSTVTLRKDVSVGLIQATYSTTRRPTDPELFNTLLALYDLSFQEQYLREDVPVNEGVPFQLTLLEYPRDGEGECRVWLGVRHPSDPGLFLKHRNQVLTVDSYDVHYRESMGPVSKKWTRVRTLVNGQVEDMWNLVHETRLSIFDLESLPVSLTETFEALHKMARRSTLEPYPGAEAFTTRALCRFIRRLRRFLADQGSPDLARENAEAAIWAFDRLKRQLRWVALGEADEDGPAQHSEDWLDILALLSQIADAYGISEASFHAHLSLSARADERPVLTTLQEDFRTKRIYGHVPTRYQ
jgi:hypothetical protein